MKNPCDDNKVKVTANVTIPAFASYKLTLPTRTPTTGNTCGTYQDDVWINSIEDQWGDFIKQNNGIPCHIGTITNPPGRVAPAAAGWCQTGKACTLPAPNAPSITSAVGCMAGASNGNVATVNWSNNNVTFVDIGLDAGMKTFYNKAVTGSTFATSAPTGFNGWSNASGPLTMQPNTRYYFRLYNGSNQSSIVSYTTPPLCAATCKTDIKGTIYDETGASLPIPPSNVTTPGLSMNPASFNRYWIAGACAGAHTLTATVPSGYTPRSQTVAITADGTNPYIQDFRVTKVPPCTNSIAGTVFEDTNTDFAYTAGVDKLIGGAQITVTDFQKNKYVLTPTTGSGAYSSAANLCPGKATVTMTGGLPIGNSYEYPKGPATYQMTLGTQATCQTDADAYGASHLGMKPLCTAGNVSGLNFALLGASTTTWFQSVCGSMRMEPFSDKMPPTSYAIIDSLLGTTCTNRPGVTYSIPFPSTFDFGSVTSGASAQNWQVANAYTPKVTKTSYEYLTKSAISQNITYAAPGTCLPGTCTLARLPHGLYQVSGDTSIPGLTISTGNFIVLVSGNVAITGDILVSPGSTLMIVAGGTLTVNGSVQNLQGVYVAGTTLNILNSGVVCGADATQLIVQGSLLANANRTGGSFTNSRKICSGIPGTQLFSRPDLLLNMSSFIKQRKGLWQELVP